MPIDPQYFLDRPLLLGAIVLLSIPVLGLLHLAAAALANAESPYWRSTLLGVLTFGGTLVIGYFALQFAEKFVDPEIESTFSQYHWMALGATVVISWIVGGVVYSVAMPGYGEKGFSTSFFEVLLRLLAIALVGGVAAVVFAVSQVARDPQNHFVLYVTGGTVGGVLTLAVLLFVFSNGMRNRSR